MLPLVIMEVGRMAQALAVGGQVEVLLHKQGREKVRYRADVLADDGGHLVVRAPWAGTQARDFGFVRFEDGDVFTEHYWRDRWYSVKEVRDPAGMLKGWYCDVTRPARLHGARLEVEDLDLDLWVPAGGGPALRLDEDEFLASGLPERDPAAAARARRALDELEALAATRFTALG
jgi:predicted RNA-binding protein associated with RNAse of E/G family